MDKGQYQVFIVFNNKSYTIEISDNTKIRDLMRNLAIKFTLPFIDDLSLYPEIKHSAPFYLRYSSKALDENQFETIGDFNKFYHGITIEKEASFHLMMSYSSKIWKLIENKTLTRAEYIVNK